MALTQVNAGLIDSTSQPNSFKNRIINGAMMIDQRNAGASVSGSGGGAYVADRFYFETSNTAVTVQQVSDAPAGFTKSLKWTTTTGASLVAGSYADIQQHIEGYSFADFNYGTASASPMAVSFWVKSSVTGTFSVIARLTGGVNVGYITTYAINSANTWEYKTVIIPGNTVNAPASTTTGYSLTLYFVVGAGSTYQTPSINTWGSAAVTGYGASTTSTNAVFTTTGATFQITGVQLEKGSTATSFDYRPYGTELALCQRYYSVFADWYFRTYQVSGGYFGFTGGLPVSMRAVPTMTIVGTPAYGNASGMVAIASNSAAGFNMYAQASTSGDSRFSCSGSSNYITASAEL